MHCSDGTSPSQRTDDRRGARVVREICGWADLRSRLPVQRDRGVSHIITSELHDCGFAPCFLPLIASRPSIRPSLIHIRDLNLNIKKADDLKSGKCSLLFCLLAKQKPSSTTQRAASSRTRAKSETPSARSPPRPVRCQTHGTLIGSSFGSAQIRSAVSRDRKTGTAQLNCNIVPTTSSWD